MFKEKFARFGEDKDGFSIIERGAFMGLPKGLLEAGDVLWQLWDIGVKFGQEGNNGIWFKAEPLILELYDFRNIRNGGLGFTVGRKNGIGIIARIQIFELRNGMRVIWDTELSVSEIQLIIKAVDAYADSQGLIKNGIRLMDDAESFKIKNVEKVFAKKDSFFLVMADDLDEIIQRFDRPELLSVIEVGMIFQIICLTSEKEDVKKEVKRILERIERDLGIFPKKIGDISAQESESLRALLRKA
ncbi:MAG: hypothetical protein Q8L10_02815 [Candidatus Moranbacteria bacterium]|nr:hypothetical protein [Candidatus Moranbacteria bacterium]